MEYKVIIQKIWHNITGIAVLIVFPVLSVHLVHCSLISIVCVYINVIAWSRSALLNQISCHFQLPHFVSDLRVTWEHKSSISLYRPKRRAELHQHLMCSNHWQLIHLQDHKRVSPSACDRAAGSLSSTISPCKTCCTELPAKVDVVFFHWCQPLCFICFLIKNAANLSLLKPFKNSSVSLKILLAM